jgi:hypothetical protein
VNPLHDEPGEIVMPVSGATPGSRTSRLNLPQWLTAFFLGVIAACLLLRQDHPLGSVALAQSTAMSGARGVFAFTGQLGKDRFGLFMVDVDQASIWCYEIRGKDLELMAGRTWRYDRYLENFNVGEQSPADVGKMVEEERKRRLQGATVPPPASSDPTTPQSP